ncbi:MAG: hypothetical protein K8U57_23845 [Planctomycetes bacterium]|nr:hypothetical protein [Planctomycetota bacterium]
MFRRLFALTGLLFALAGSGMFVALAIAAWKIKAEVERETNDLATRANAAGDEADRAINFVGKVIETAQADLNAARVPVSAPEHIRVNPLVQMSARQTSINLAGSLERALGAVTTASDTVVVVNAALQLASGSEQFEKMFGVRPDQIAQTQTALGSVAGELREARSILGIPVSSSGEPATVEQLDAVDNALRLAGRFREEMSKIVGDARKRVNETKQQIDLWAWRLAVAVTALSVVGTVGQFFLARFCVRKLNNLPA